VKLFAPSLRGGKAAGVPARTTRRLSLAHQKPYSPSRLIHYIAQMWKKQYRRCRFAAAAEYRSIKNPLSGLYGEFFIDNKAQYKL
jgi:hypothetical protein